MPQPHADDADVEHVRAEDRAEIEQHGRDDDEGVDARILSVRGDQWHEQGQDDAQHEDEADQGQHVDEIGKVELARLERGVQPRRAEMGRIEEGAGFTGAIVRDQQQCERDRHGGGDSDGTGVVDERRIRVVGVEDELALLARRILDQQVGRDVEAACRQQRQDARQDRQQRDDIEHHPGHQDRAAGRGRAHPALADQGVVDAVALQGRAHEGEGEAEADDGPEPPQAGEAGIGEARPVLAEADAAPARARGAVAPSAEQRVLPEDEQADEGDRRGERGQDRAQEADDEQEDVDRHEDGERHQEAEEQLLAGAEILGRAAGDDRATPEVAPQVGDVPEPVDREGDQREQEAFDHDADKARCPSIERDLSRPRRSWARHALSLIHRRGPPRRGGD